MFRSKPTRRIYIGYQEEYGVKKDEMVEEEVGERERERQGGASPASQQNQPPISDLDGPSVFNIGPPGRAVLRSVPT
jgi:hypothetical protein